MASGDLLVAWTPQANEAPAGSAATFNTRNNIPVLDFDAASDEFAVFSGVLPSNYGGGGVTVKIVWTAASATSNNTIWQAAFERMNTDMDGDSFASAQSSAASAANGSPGVTTTATIAFTDGAQMDSLAVGEAFRLRINRDANSASDTMTGDAEVIRVMIFET